MSRARRRSWAAAGSVVTVLAALTACGSDEPTASDRASQTAGAQLVTASKPARTATAATVAETDARLTGLGSLGEIPTDLVGTPDGKELLVAGRTGRVGRYGLRTSDGVLVPTPQKRLVLDLRPLVSAKGEQGLLGLQTTADGRTLLVAYSALDGALTVDAFPYEPGAHLDPSQRRNVVRIEHPYYDDNGGDLERTEDGDVIVSVGSMDTGDVTNPTAQDPGTPLGKIVRLPAALVAGTMDSQDFDPLDGVLATGLRNPWRIAVDPETGDLWIADVGDKRVEEVDRIAADDLGKDVPNFGWPYLEGSKPLRGKAPDASALTPPVFERRHGPGTCAIVGGFVYRGRNLPGLNGAYIYGDTCSDQIRAVLLRGDEVLEDRTIARLDTPGAISFGQGAAGELYVMGVTGTIDRIDPSSWKVDDVDDELGTRPPFGSSSTTTTSAPKATELNCRVAGSLEQLSELQSLSPQEVEALFGEVTSGLDEIKPTLPADLQPDVQLVRDSFQSLAEVLQANGWDPKAPASLAAQAQAGRGEGPWAGFAAAINRVLGRIRPGC